MKLVFYTTLFLFILLLTINSMPFASATESDLDFTTLTASPPSLNTVDSSGGHDLQVGQNNVVTTTVSNNDNSNDVIALTIVEIRDSHGVTVLLEWRLAAVDAGRATDVGISWVPARADSYELRTFAISGLDNAQILSAISSSTVSISPFSGNLNSIELDNKTYMISYKIFNSGELVSFSYGQEINGAYFLLEVKNVIEDGEIEFGVPWGF